MVNTNNTNNYSNIIINNNVNSPTSKKVKQFRNKKCMCLFCHIHFSSIYFSAEVSSGVSYDFCGCHGFHSPTPPRHNAGSPFRWPSPDS